MNIPDAVVVYVAATNLEAHVIADLLQTNDVPAIAVEDQSLVGMWIGGTLPMIHRPKIWVSRKHVEQAHVLIREYEAQSQSRRYPQSEEPALTVVCEECGAVSTFAASLDGTTQECSKCRAFVDVGQSAWDADVGSAEEEDEPPSE